MKEMVRLDREGGIPMPKETVLTPPTKVKALEKIEELKSIILKL